ncbi:MAG: ATP-binding protein [Gemmataceae bacterium]
MAETSKELVVRSHVARDLLQTAGLFKSDRLVVWEYVANGLQYVDPGTNPQVRVMIDAKKKRIAISDNGRGMDWRGLQNFFIMHGENLDRKEGKAGRGRFGTGKSAAFGIADTLRLSTVCNGSRSIVELRRRDIQAMTSGTEIPVKVVERETRTSDPNGTLVEIENVSLRSIDQASIIRYIERHMARWPKNITVSVNNHLCDVSEPPLDREIRHRAQGRTREILGDVELVVKTSKRPLEEDERGISIFSRGIWHAVTLAGCEGRDMSQYIFGEIDVPRLEEDVSAVPPFDVTRSMELNPNNDLVREVFAFIYEKVEDIRRSLMEVERRRKATEEARKLATQAAEIANVINEDFDTFRGKVAKVRAKAVGGTDLFGIRTKGEEPESALVSGGPLPASEVSPIGSEGKSGDGETAGGDPPDLKPFLQPQDDGPEKGQPVKAAPKKVRPRGGFQVRFEHIGTESNRAKYVSDERTIYLNLDHPQLLAARGAGPVEDPTFRRLAYEVAFTEYSIALATELAQLEGYYIDPTDPIFDIGETLNRLARKGARLYSATN